VQQRSSVLNLLRPWSILCNHVDFVLFPRTCACCGIPLFNVPILKKYGKGGLSALGRPIHDSFLCSNCVKAIAFIKSPLCSICGEPFESLSGPDHTCGRCLKNKPHFDMARSIFLYEGTIQALIHHIKYHGDGFSLKALASLAKPFIETMLQDQPPDLICPVPLHDSRLRKRGFNQSAALVSTIFTKQKSKIAQDLLTKSKKTAPQVGLSRHHRIRNVRNSFRLRKPLSTSVKNVILLDDVLTTGATASECARVLKKGHDIKVFVITIARAGLQGRDGHQLDNS